MEHVTTNEPNLGSLSGRSLGLLALTFAGSAVAATAYTIHRDVRSRQVQVLQDEEALSTWEDEGGNTAPSA